MIISFNSWHSLTFFLFVTYSITAHPSISCEVNAGSSICGRPIDIGSSPVNVVPGTMVGNPVDAVNANKYQMEVDFIIPDSPLMLIRHYNSQHSETDRGFGKGWRMSFSLQLLVINADQLQITQSDGRRILFNRDSSERKTSYISTSSADGTIVVDGRFRIWKLPDGRHWIFKGPFPVKLVFNETSLTIKYSKNRIKSVTDHRENSFTFIYGENSITKNHVLRVDLTSDQSLSYKYDKYFLKQIIRNNVIARHYHYKSNESSALLTGLTDESGKRVNRIWYDDARRPIRVSNSIEGQDVSLEYHDPSLINENGTVYITGNNGESGKFVWFNSTPGNRRLLKSSSISLCKLCPILNRTYNYSSTDEFISIDTSNGKRHFINPLGLTSKISEEEAEFPITLKRTIFGSVKSVRQHINKLSFDSSDADRKQLLTSDNARASAFTLDLFNSNDDEYVQSDRLMSNCEFLGPASDSVQVILDDVALSQQTNETSDEDCNLEHSDIAVDYTPSIPGATFMEAWAADCVSYFDAYFGTNRGFRIEDGFASHPDFSGALSTVRRYPVVDFLRNREAIAIISRDLRSPTYNNPDYPESLYRRLMRDAREMRENFLNPIEENGAVSSPVGILTTTIQSQDFDRFLFELVVQHGTATLQQLQQIVRAQADISSMYGIEMQVTEIP